MARCNFVRTSDFASEETWCVVSYYTHNFVILGAGLGNNQESNSIFHSFFLSSLFQYMAYIHIYMVGQMRFLGLLYSI